MYFQIPFDQPTRVHRQTNNTRHGLNQSVEISTPLILCIQIESPATEMRRVLAGRETSSGGRLDINLYFVFSTKRGRDPSHLNMFHRNKSAQFADAISNMGWLDQNIHHLKPLQQPFSAYFREISEQWFCDHWQRRFCCYISGLHVG